MLSALYPLLLESILIHLSARDLCSLSETNHFFDDQTRRFRVRHVMCMLSQGWKPSDRCWNWTGESATMYPPHGRLLRSEYIRLAEEFEKDPVLRGSAPAMACEGGFEWNPDVVTIAMTAMHFRRRMVSEADFISASNDFRMTMRSYNVRNSGIHERTWEEASRRLTEAESWDAPVEICEYHWQSREIPAVLWRVKGFTPRVKLERAVDIMIRRGWGLIKTDDRNLKKKRRLRVSDISSANKRQKNPL